jgi:transcription-repair coupling factor (superfamily II helicase)
MLKKNNRKVSIKAEISQKILAELNYETSLDIKKLTGAFKSLVIQDIFDSKQYSPFIFAENYNTAEEIYNDLRVLYPDEKIAFILPPEKSVRSELSKEEDLPTWLIEGLNRYSKEDCIAISTPELLDQMMPKQAKLSGETMKIKKGEEYDFEEFTKKLYLKGFNRETFVANQGDIAVRGGIVDIFPISWNNPIRIEFWGDKIDSIREFDSLSQRSIKEYNELEFIADLFSRVDEYDVGIFDYFKDNSLIILDEPDSLDQDIIEKHIKKLYQYKLIRFNPLNDPDIAFKTEKSPSVEGSIKTLTDELEKYFMMRYKIVISADGSNNLKRIKELIESELENRNIVDLLSKIIWSENPFSTGFISNDDKLIVFTEHQIFNRKRTKLKRSKKKSESLTFAELQALNPGDFVVHADKGIARFEGFKAIEIGGAKQDCMRLAFAEDDLIYVNLNYITKISKYAASDGLAPKLSKLGTTEWIRKKARTKKKIKDIARDLIKLYAKRKMQKGFPYPQDTDWQKEFEASFLYEDTPDQATATEQVKEDMETAIPMDRLICGDVGFGKTEIAIRAAFKAVQGGKQVAVLVPTTILAHQHYMSFKDRMHRYPVNIEVISRFKKKKSQKEILSELDSGRVDILIGTHRLLSKDIQFRDLGLLIIDEEQRFGVSAKEKLRKYKETVDTLTLTATPIPRTLNFSLMGARDLSIMETPPRNRLPVTTEIINWDEDKIANAIINEVNRNGQCFFVTDKVKDIEEIGQQLHDLLPDLKYAIAHGQMTGTQLEKIMAEFIEGKYDVLIATKIIESGIDIPNANTMIINRANNFGLAELYQLRGRVGRTNKQAYCYLVVPNAKKMNKQAILRLQAVEEFTDLGSGFKLAMRDLEIRGAGNLLGGEQSGFIIDMGFDLYQKVLEEAVSELKDDEFKELFDNERAISFSNRELAIELKEDALFPESYITDSTQRYSYYKRLFAVNTIQELNDISIEIKDKFGFYPDEVANLFFVVKLRIAGVSTGFHRVAIKEDTMICEFPAKENKKFYQYAFPLILDYIQNFDNVKVVQVKKKAFLEFEIDSRDSAVEQLWKLRRTLEIGVVDIEENGEE